VRFLSLGSCAAAAMMAEWRINGRAASGTSAKSSPASMRLAMGSSHSGGLSQRSRWVSRSLAAAAMAR